MAHANTALSDTFNTWRINTNLLATEFNTFKTGLGNTSFRNASANNLIANSSFVSNTLSLFSGNADFSNTTFFNLPTSAVDANTELAASVVTAHAIAAGAIGANTKLGSSVVTAHAIKNVSVFARHIANGAIDANTKISASAVTAHAIAAGAIGANTKLGSGVITRHAIANTANAVFTDKSQAFTAPQRGKVVTISNLGSNTALSTKALDFNTAQFFILNPIANNMTFSNPANTYPGQSGSITIVQDGTGSRTASWGVNWHFPSNTAPTLSTTANYADRIDYYVESANQIHAVATIQVRID